VFAASNLKVVERRAQKYLFDDAEPALLELRRFLADNILNVGRAGILGGLIRELARIGKVGFRSDVDLVIDAPKAHVSELAARLGAKRNRFGGYSFRHPLWKFDFWSLETTWALRRGHITVGNLDEVTRCTFFDCDAVFFDLVSKRVSANDDYLARLRSKVLEINLLPNPSPDGNLVRAVRRLVYWDFLPGPVLREFLEEQINERRLEKVIRVEQGLYGRSVAEYFGTAKKLKDALLNGRYEGARSSVPEY